MKVVFALLFAWLTLAVTSAFATTVGGTVTIPGGQASESINVVFDENGNGTITVAGVSAPLIGLVLPDPSQTGLPNALIYTLPTLVGEGDLSITDSTAGGGSVRGDVVRFTDALGGLSGSGNLMIFYSDVSASDPSNSKADTGFPSNINTGNTALVAEVGPEGNNGFNYSADTNTYQGISDSPSSTVPEPASMTLLGSGLLGLAGLLRRRKTAR